MPDQVIDIPGLGPTAFPDSMSEAQINAAATRLYQEANPGKKQPPVSNWGAIGLQAASKAIAPTGQALEAFGTSPTAAKTFGALANAGTTLAGVGHGVATGNIPEIIASPIAGWQAGKGGYWLGKRMQDLARPIATSLEKAAPLAQKLSAASGAQGALDLAQIAEPNRKDIGTLGVTLGDEHDPQHPALVNLLLSKASEGVSKLVDQGMSAESALAAWLKGKR